MRPPICDVCHRKIESGPWDEGQAGLVFFEPSEEDKVILEKMKKPGYTGHPPNAGWFCEDHYFAAQELRQLTLSEAIRKIKS